MVPNQPPAPGVSGFPFPQIHGINEGYDSRRLPLARCENQVFA